MGIRLELKQVYGTGYATAVFVQEKRFQRVFCVGQQGLREELNTMRIDVCDDERMAEALIIGMDTDFDRVKLSKALHIIKMGGTAIACNYCIFNSYQSKFLSSSFNSSELSMPSIIFTNNSFSERTI